MPKKITSIPKTQQEEELKLSTKPVKYNYEEFLDKERKKHRYFVLINKETLDKRILASEEEVIFAGKYLINPTIFGFRTLTEAKTYLAGPSLPQKVEKFKKKEIYSSDRKEEKEDLIRKAKKAQEAYLKAFNKIW